MARKQNYQRFYDIVNTATSVFINKGYKRTKMEDITRLLGLSAGAIYRYVESKEALFDLTVRLNLNPDMKLEEISCPVATPKQDSILQFVRESSQLKRRFPALQKALKQNLPANINNEFTSVVMELYKVLADNRTAIKLIECCALDWPELADLWFHNRRSEIFALLIDYLKARQKYLRDFPDIKAAARLLIVNISFFAIHRHFDIVPMEMDEKISEFTVTKAMIGAFLRTEKE